MVIFQAIQMSKTKIFDAIIVGGSYAGLSAAMALGRALRNVLVIDSGLPCNRQTPHSHNFITQDGERPDAIAEKARMQVLNYPTVRFLKGLVVSGKKTKGGFSITAQSGEKFNARKLIFATGVKDILPDIQGFSACWGISAIHCPYCHGYEVRAQRTGILANGNDAFHYAQLIKNWTKDLIIFTNGKSTITKDQIKIISRHNIQVIEKKVAHLKHKDGHIQQIVFKDNSSLKLQAIYSRPAFKQHCDIPEQLGCELNEQGLLKTDIMHQTTLEGVFVCGDASSPARAVAVAVSTGLIAGSSLNNKLTEEEFGK